LTDQGLNRYLRVVDDTLETMAIVLGRWNAWSPNIYDDRGNIKSTKQTEKDAV
jgi:hypothetical protein